MGLFDIFKKPIKPYKDDSTNLIYELLFCDNIDLYKKNSKEPDTFPWNILLTETSSKTELEKITSDSNVESRVKILAYNRLLQMGLKTEVKELLAVIVEVGLDGGLDTLASFSDGTARYINQTGKIIVWETTDERSSLLTKQLFKDSASVVEQIGPWEQPRRPYTTKGNVRITFLVSDGLYFGEGPINVLFNDQLANPALTTATELMKYLTEQATKN